MNTGTLRERERTTSLWIPVAMLAAATSPRASQAEELVQPPRPPPAGVSVISKFDTLRQPQLDKVLELECEAFPPCEQLGSVLLQQQAALRTGGLLIAEVGMHVVGFCLVSRSASSGLIAKVRGSQARAATARAALTRAARAPAPLLTDLGNLSTPHTYEPPLAPAARSSHHCVCQCSFA